MIPYSGNPVIINLKKSFELLYGDKADICIRRTAAMAGRYGIGFDLTHPPSRWNQRSGILITYGDVIRAAAEPPLTVLGRFAARRLIGAFNTVHILPFFPYSSDDGFSVIHFRNVNPELGRWEDIQNIGKHFRMMFDLVLNHVSRKSGWFRDYELGIAPGRGYFIEANPSEDLTAVVRPRTSPLLTKVNTNFGARNIWTTFSSDQLDLDYSNINVLFEMLDILLFYVSMGARIIRLDAIAYVWKRIGTPCVNLPETHEVVKVFRAILDLVAPDVLLLTETNLPHEENISYFGNGDEAQIVYQFSLPPLILQALLSGSARYLTSWSASLADPPPGCTFLNFTASHDGIGVRPLEGLVPREAVDELLKQVRQRGGRVSSRRAEDGTETPYEMNITYFDALSFPASKENGLHVDRFICSQVIPLSLKGIPAIYFNSLLAAENDYVLARQTGQARSLNRTKWDECEVDEMLDNPKTNATRVFGAITRAMNIRARHPSFHPDGAQRVLGLGDAVFAVERIAPEGSERVLAIHNMTREKVLIPARQIEESGFDLRAGTDLLAADGAAAESGDGLALGPYQCAWVCFQTKQKD